MNLQFPNAVGVIVSGGTDKDTISNEKMNVTISGGSGNDSIRNTGENVLIKAGSDNDKIYNYGDNSSINGGEGRDTIKNYAADVTITGGKGNDYIYLTSAAKNNLIQYASGDGNDTIVGINSDDTLQIAGSYSTTTSGKNIIVNVGTDKIILKNAINKTVTIESIMENKLIAEENFKPEKISQENLITFAK